MTKKDLIALRDQTQDPETKKALRWAIDEIQNLETRVRDVRALASAILAMTNN